MKPKVTAKDFQVAHANDWCPGCGDFGILTSLQQALAGLELEPHDVAVFGGIGCSGKAQYQVNAYGVSTLHGRVLPFATGAKLTNPDLEVVIVGGDGDGLGIGAGHFVNAGRRNLDMAYILFNNEVYGLTKGQASPTLPLGLQPKSLPEPNLQSAINPLLLALASGFTWIGRGYAFHVPKLVELIKQAIQHEGLAYLDVLQPCPTYNNLHDKDWFAGMDMAEPQPRVYYLSEDYDPRVPEDADEETLSARMGAFVAKANEWGDRIPLGVFLENRSPATFEERIQSRIESYRAAPPAQRSIADEKGRPTADLTSVFEELAMT
ncbi:MAG: thiamine pyrophosphate-dependent enzyme [Anaerolineae bacterium]